MRKLMVVLLAGWASVGSLCAQAVNATLLGTVSDSSGASIAAAKVVATEVNTGVSRSSQTNGSGNYSFPDLPPGSYSIDIESPGFKRDRRLNINVVVNSSVRVDATLQPGNITESIEVTAAPPLLQTDRADTGRKIEASEAAALPLGVNRNFQGLLNLVPGTTRASFQHSQFFNAQSSLQTQVNGQMRMGNNYQIEGIDDNQRTGLLQILIPPIEAIQTVDVSTSNFEAELGRATGAVTNVILKSGTNQFHGQVYEFFRNSNLNARNFFDRSIGRQSYNYFGGNIGGPIQKNKVFFFADYLKVFDHQQNANLANIPTTAYRTGNLSASTTTIYNPFTGNANGTGRQAFAGNQIPASLINPISARLLALVPQPNQGGFNNYFATLPYFKDQDYVDVKVDDNLTDSDRVSVRFSFQRPIVSQASIFGAAGGPAQGGFQATGIQRTYSTGINYNHIFSPTLITEVRAGVAYYRNEAQPNNYGANTSTEIGIPGVNISEMTSGLVGVNINGYSAPMVGYSPSLPWIRAEANINFVNTWTKIVGNHTVKWGADIRRIRDDLLQGQSFSPRGLYQFSDGQTSIPGARTSLSNSFASFLLDVPNSAGRDLFTFFPAYRATQVFGFVQDKWIVTPKLTIDAGLRWEYYPPATPRFAGGFSNYNPSNNTLELGGIGNTPRNLGVRTRYKYFAPRLGVAYRATTSTVIRSGFGISYTPFPDNNYAYNFPVRQNNSYQPAVASFGPAVLPNGQTATFQAGFPTPIPATIPASGIIPATGALNAQNYFVVNRTFKQPYVISYNFAVQQALPMRFTLDVSYVGNKGVNIVAQPNINAATVTGLGNPGRPLFRSFGRTADTTLLYQGFSSLYNSLQVKLDRRFATGLTMTTAYTFGKAMGYQMGDNGALAYYINVRRNYARTDYDRTHVFVQSYNYKLPFGRNQKWLNDGKTAAIFGGWQVNGILTLQSGTPLNFTSSGASLLAPGNQQSPNLVAPLTISKGINVGNEWFSRNSFAAPTGTTFGNVGRNILRGPGFYNLDFSLFKTFAFTERFNLEVRGETFNLSNTPQFANPNTNLQDANYGYVTSVNSGGGARSVQLGLKLSF